MSKFTTDRTYPREWYGVDSRWGDVRSKEFVGETEYRLREPANRGRLRFTEKSTNWTTWYPTLEEAEAASAAIKARREAQVAERRVRDAAQELLVMLKACDALLERDGYAEDSIAREGIRKAIAKAEGGAA